ANQVRLAATDGGKMAPASPDGASWALLADDLAPDVTELIDAVDRWRARPRRRRTADELRAGLIRLRYAVDLLELEFAGLAAAFAATEEPDWCGSVSPADWIRPETRMSASPATAAVTA